MDLNRIEKLLEQYDEGETSLAEEQLLRNYFNNEEVPVHLRSYQLIFAFAQDQKNETLKNTPKIEASRNYKFAWTSIAAIIIVALGLFYFNDSSRILNQSELGTISDEEIALQKTKETLQMVSQIMNDGSADLVYLQEFNKTKNQIIEID